MSYENDDDEDYPPFSVARKVVADHAYDLPKERQEALYKAIHDAMGEFANMYSSLDEAGER